MSVVSNRLKKQTNLANSVIQDIMNFQGDDWGERVSYEERALFLNYINKAFQNISAAQDLIVDIEKEVPKK